jgi:hypothetical protein
MNAKGGKMTVESVAKMQQAAAPRQKLPGSPPQQWVANRSRQVVLRGAAAGVYPVAAVAY